MKAACMGLISVPRWRTIPVTPTNRTPLNNIQPMPLRLLAEPSGVPSGRFCGVVVPVMPSAQAEKMA